MTEQATASPQAQPLQFMLADADPIFRLGLKACLESVPDLEVIAEAESPAQVLSLLSPDSETADTSAETVTPSRFNAQTLDLIVMDVGSMASPDANAMLCQQLKARYPDLSLFVLSNQSSPEELAKLWQVGVEGFCGKGQVATTDLIQRCRQASRGQRVWESAPKAQVQMVLQPDSPRPVPSSREVTAFTFLRQAFMDTGLRQLEQTLSQLAERRQQPLTQWQRAVSAGRTRELQSVRWMVRRFLDQQQDAPPNSPQETPQPETASSWGEIDPWETDTLTAVPSRITEVMTEHELATTPDISTLLMEALLAKLPSSLHNRTPDPLEIDILKAQKRQDLFLIVLKRFEGVLDELRFSQVTRSQLVSKPSQILQDLWLGSTADFFGKYLTLPLSNAAQASSPEIEIVSVLAQDQGIVEAEILSKIPLVTALLEHLLFQAPLLVDNALCGVGSPEAMLQAEALLSNIVVNVANAVIQPLLNRFATNEIIKQSFYDRTLISTREIERFRNALSSHYRLRRWFLEPKEIFESQYGLVIFSESGLQKISVYTSRDQELKQLQGIRYLVTLGLEARDAIAPPLRATFTFLGRGVVYILTQVIGRGLGLIGRGILQGVGGTWQELFVSRKSHQEK